MNYEYTAHNQFDSPHLYMYSSYHGSGFFNAYFFDREKRLTCYSDKLRLHDKTKLDLMQLSKKITAEMCISNFSIDCEIELMLLQKGIINLFINERLMLAEKWLALIIQRYEVTKKLYAKYLPGFRIGVGCYRDVMRYVEFSFCLTLAYQATRNLQYLSTLLKVNDLLLSIEVKEYINYCEPDFIRILIDCEVNFIKELIKEDIVGCRVV